MMVARIRDYGLINHGLIGSNEDMDDIVFLLIKYGHWTDFDNQIWRISHNCCEGFNVSCYDIGKDSYCKTMEELVETLKLLLEGSL